MIYTTISWCLLGTVFVFIYEPIHLLTEFFVFLLVKRKTFSVCLHVLIIYYILYYIYIEGVKTPTFEQIINLQSYNIY